MGQAFDHDRIEELMATVVGLSLAVDALTEALSALATDNAAVGALLAPHLAKVRAALAAAEREAAIARAVAEDRWASAPKSSKRPEPRGR